LEYSPPSALHVPTLLSRLRCDLICGDRPLSSCALGRGICELAPVREVGARGAPRGLHTERLAPVAILLQRIRQMFVVSRNSQRNPNREEASLPFTRHSSGATHTSGGEGLGSRVGCSLAHPFKLRLLDCGGPLRLWPSIGSPVRETWSQQSDSDPARSCHGYRCARTSGGSVLFAARTEGLRGRPT